MSRNLFLEITGKARSEGRKTLSFQECARLCGSYGIPIVDSGLAKNVEEAVRVAEKIGYPVALKVESSEILHKSDVGGVLLNITDGESLRRAYNQLVENVRKSKPGANIDGVSVSRMAKPGKELIIGANKDRTFGHVLLFGLGGIFTEVFEDFSLRVAPIYKEEALEMINEIRGAKILEGYRGTEKVDKDALAEILMAIGRMVTENPEITSLDLNPVIGYSRGATVVDVKVVFDSQ
ncbi:MAG: acetate--CoA ligase family protein [Aigarchaeota archaeon]|nr:acetate--CoA ligase family protein [Aigarchaeota archaeon]MDW8092228.1 acetate--CoA ligase family protein [Nitrososphaerota archaeon]